jgi:hypothetical protein
MKVLLAILCFLLTSCEAAWLAAYRQQGGDPKPRKYVPIVRDFGGLNGRETWLYSPSQLKP